MSVFTWSQTAADNDDADGTINCREGQAPSTINDSMRAIMAAIAKWRDDTSGKLVTGGTASALTLTSNQTFTALSDGITVTALLGTAINASATLNVDSLGATAIHGISGTAVTAGFLAGEMVTFTYDSSATAWVVRGGSQGREFVSGTSMVFYQAAAPTGWTAEAINNKALRVVSSGGTGGSDGGTTAFTSVFTARTITASNLPDHSITITDPGHTHVSITSHGTTDAQGGGQRSCVNAPSETSNDGTETNSYTTGSSTTGITAAFGTAARGGAQTAMDFAVQYSDVIIATKD